MLRQEGQRRGACATVKGSRMDIALVHGSYHGAWCWDLLRPELERLGHRVITVDLAISDPSLGAADYAKTVSDALAPRTKPILVGHSMAGLVIPLVAARRPVRRPVFLAAFLPAPGVGATGATQPGAQPGAPRARAEGGQE